MKYGYIFCDHKLLCKISISYKFVLSTCRPRLDRFCIRNSKNMSPSVTASPKQIFLSCGHELLSKIYISCRFILSTLRPRLAELLSARTEVHRSAFTAGRKQHWLLAKTKSTRFNLVLFVLPAVTPRRIEAYCFSSGCMIFFLTSKYRQPFRFSAVESPRLYLGSWEVSDKIRLLNIEEFYFGNFYHDPTENRTPISRMKT